MYQRVLPRDLFNEAKLLKCLGKLCMLIEDGLCQLSFDYDTSEDDGFRVHQLRECGGIYSANLRFYTPAGDEVEMNSPLNSRQSWPLLFYYNGEEHPVFDEDGALSDEFNKCEEGWCESH